MSVSKSIQVSGCGMLGGGEHGEHKIGFAVAVSSEEDALPVFPKDLEATIPVGGKSRRRLHLGTPLPYRCPPFCWELCSPRLARCAPKFTTDFVSASRPFRVPIPTLFGFISAPDLEQIPPHHSI
jgi:hypothetical protein